MSDTGALSMLTTPPYPMLAKPGKVGDVARAVAQGYIIEPKLDGIRCMAVVGDGLIQLYNRQLVNITSRFPDVVDAIRLRTGVRPLLGRLVLDGEIYVRDEAGLPDFQLVQHRANRTLAIEQAVADYPAVFTTFDVLGSGAFTYSNYSLRYRRAILEEVVGPMVVATYTQDEADEHVKAQTGEGLMLKLASSHYHAGVRDPAWLKVKWLREAEVVIGGVTHGTGKREPYFGGLLMGVPLPDDRHGDYRMTYVGTVGTGYTDVQLEFLSTHLRNLRSVVCPFEKQGSDWDLKYFVKPIVRAHVKFAEYTRDGIMRFPRFHSL